MVGRKHLLKTAITGASIALVLAVVGADSSSASGDDDCSSLQALQGLCTSGSANGGGVDVSGTSTGRQHGVGPGDDSPGSSTSSTTQGCDSLQECLPYLDLFEGGVSGANADGSLPSNILFRPPVGTPAGAAGGGVAATTVTAKDVARFLPIDGVVHTEPHGWAVVGVPANVWVDLHAVTVAGELLGTTADVRFTPIAYRWDYGDGTGRATTTAGASWASLGQAELTATNTGHVYSARGSRRVSVRALYSAEYRIGGGAWLAVVGTVVAEEPSVPMQVVVEGTVLTTADG